MTGRAAVVATTIATWSLKILIAKRRGMAKQPIADALGVHHTVVQRVLNADMKHSLTVVS